MNSIRDHSFFIVCVCVYANGEWEKDGKKWIRKNLRENKYGRDVRTWPHRLISSKTNNKNAGAHSYTMDSMIMCANRSFVLDFIREKNVCVRVCPI